MFMYICMCIHAHTNIVRCLFTSLRLLCLSLPHSSYSSYPPGLGCCLSPCPLFLLSSPQNCLSDHTSPPLLSDFLCAFTLSFLSQSCSSDHTVISVSVRFTCFSLFFLPLMSPCQGFSLSWSNILYPTRKRGPYNHSCLRLESRTLIPFVYLFIYSSHFFLFCFCVFIWFLGILLLFLPVASYASACPLHTHHGPVRPHTSSAFYMPHYLAVCLLVRHLLACPNTCLSLIS